jgi:hypothetical protein
MVTTIPTHSEADRHGQTASKKHNKPFKPPFARQENGVARPTGMAMNGKKNLTLSPKPLPLRLAFTLTSNEALP